MKLIIKLTSLLLCLLLLLTSVISCASTESQTTTDSTAETTSADTTEAPETTEADATEAPETDAPKVPEVSLPELTVEELTADFVDGEYTLDDTPVRPHELLTALYRIAGDPEASRDFEVVWYVGEKDEYYHDATVWSAFQAGIIPFALNAVGETSNCYVIRSKLGFRVGVKTTDELMAEFSEGLKDCEISYIESYLNFDTDISRTDAVLAMYYYVTTYLGKEVTTDDVLESVTDYELFNKMPTKQYKMYLTGSMYVELLTDFSASWLWALDAGIVEPYADNTLRPDADLTRAEFADMLTRFMDYVK